MAAKHPNLKEKTRGCRHIDPYIAIGGLIHHGIWNAAVPTALAWQVEQAGGDVLGAGMKQPA
ncbi:hypothetical protein KY084_10180 [Stakelama sp. CBK3Z-3]|uniref:Uncharacterized protein n=1 Tax=Stakelama flava TaxID=2860338 RepID=A0ABS6XLZ4_9SPHN|nr:hypothetical protein [Stakelama flava]MBW4331238.1 hypothetical protein [Stakelama flava]